MPFDKKIPLGSNFKIFLALVLQGTIVTLHLKFEKYLKKYANNNLNYSESVYEKVLWMPSSLSLTKKSISKICSVINE